MSSWRDNILREFTPKVARLTLVADPDGLLLEEGVLAGICARGFKLIPFEDHVAFRYAYESMFRSHWDHGEQTDLIVVLQSRASDLYSLPYDLVSSGRQLAFNLGDIFPNLSYPIVAALDPQDLDVLYEAQERHAPGVLGNNATKEFVLRHVFGIAPELIATETDLMRILLRRHYRGQRVPALLDERFIQILRQDGGFSDWPLETIVSDREAFLDFLQERWPAFLDRQAQQNNGLIPETEASRKFAFSGPPHLPFDHDDVRIYIDNFFLEGILQPVSHEWAASFSHTWFGIGIRMDDHSNRTRRIEGLLNTVASDIPGEGARHENWLHFARTWAELVVLALESEGKLPEPSLQKMNQLQTRVDGAFEHWLAERYAGLINLPPVPPVMLHHIPRFLSRYLNDDREHKVAFVLVDGLSLPQWVVIRKELAKHSSKYLFRETAAFAWIPTITSVSRQAALAGKPPIYFPNSIHTTDKEPLLWTQFWVDEGLIQQEIAYVKGLGSGTLEGVEAIVARPKTRVIGLIVDKIDKIMHGMELGASGMQDQVRLWAGQPFIENLFDLLLENGFCIHLSSDHGNIEAAGCGCPDEGAVADLRGERARIYPNSLLRVQVKKRFPDAGVWPPIGLPEDYLPLLAPARSAFVRETDHTVSHGGASLEEVIVPLVEVERKDR